jgi:hypothetical protein
LRAEFERTMAEPAAATRQVTTWWPAVVGLEQVLDAVTAVAVQTDQGGPAPPPDRVWELAAVLDGIGEAVRSGPARSWPVRRPRRGW